MGYHRVPTVTEVAEFSVRGGILDVYGFGMAAPARLEWWGDDISSIRGFDLTTQRSLQELSEVTVLPVSTQTPCGTDRDWRTADRTARRRRGRTLLELLPVRYAHHRGSLRPRRGRGRSAPGTRRSITSRSPGGWARRCPAGTRSSRSRTRGAARLDAFPRLLLRDERADLQFGFFPPERIDRDLNRLRALLAGAPPTLILCDNEGQLERLEELLEEGSRGADAAPRSRSARSTADSSCRPLRVLTDHEIFRRARRLRRARRYRQAAPSPRPARSPTGDYVVHLDHGIGIYRGIADDHGGRGDARGRDRRVRGRRPAQRAAVPPRPAGALSRRRRGRRPPAAQAPPPRGHQLGAGAGADPRRRSSRWRPSCSTSTPAARSPRVTPFPPDTKWQRELESSFLYEDTPDQRKATEEVKRDMERPLPDGPAAGRATWATARPRSRCAPRSRRCRAASRWRCWCPPRFWPSSTAAPSSSGWPTSR